MDSKTNPIPNADTLQLMCPTCGARYSLPRYVEGQKYGCKRCSASLMFGKFALLQELGRGGFGVVYKAWQADLQRVVALKFLHTDGDESGERFLREARIAANLNHPNITAIYEVGSNEGKLYIAMQFVDGTAANKAQFSLRDAVMVIRDASLAVDYAHGRDIVHRDIKPHNIMVTQERSGTAASETQRRTFVMDFGLARSVSKGSTLTTEGQVMGTPAYMSPEQAEGKSCDGRSDVYSLGATLYALLTRRAPFEAQTPVQVLMQVTRGQFASPSQINAEVDKNLEAIVLKAMALDPAQRYPTAARLAADLTSWLAGGVTDAGPTVHLSASKLMGVTGGAKPKNRSLVVALGLLLVLGGLGGLLYSLVPKEKGTATAADPKPPTGTGAHDPGPKTNPDPVEIPKGPPPAPTVLLHVRTDPSGAQVRLGGREWTAPVALTDRDLPPGDYTLELAKEGYKPLRESLSLKPGPAPTLVERKLDREARVVAFVVDSEPRGAKVFLNGSDTGGRTPHTIYKDEATGPTAKVELDMDGFFPQTRTVETDRGRQDVKVILEAKTGTFLLSGAAPNSTIHLFNLPPGLKNPRAVLGLWSESPEGLEQAFKDMDPADAPAAVGRLKDIAARGEARFRERAARLASTPAASASAAPERSLTADGTGSARLERVWIARRYRIFATSPRAQDFASDELEPRFREDLQIRAEMPTIGLVSATAVRPSLGTFRVQSAEGAALGELKPGGAPLRVPSGTVALTYVPPANDPALREFVLPLKVDDRFDVGGNLYLYSGEANEKDGKVLEALRSFTKALEDRNPPASELAERAKLPERVRVLYRLWIEERVRQGRPLEGDAFKRLEELKGKDAAEASSGAIGVYAAREVLPAARAAAAAAAALAEAKRKHPYESMEWLERAVREGAEPGAEAMGAVDALHRPYPGLKERFDALRKALEALKASKAPPPPPDPAPKKPAFLGIQGEDAGGAGVKVSALAKGGPADEAGVKPGDVISDLDGVNIRSHSDLDAAIAKHAAGETVPMTVTRDGVSVPLKVKLTEKPAGEPGYEQPRAAALVGVVQSNNATLGLVFVKLEQGAAVQVGQVLEVLRDGSPVAELQVSTVSTRPDRTYPHGSASCRAIRGQADKGAQVRKKM